MDLFTPPHPDPAAVDAGRRRLQRGVRNSLLMPGEVECIVAIVAALDSACSVMSSEQQAQDAYAYATAAGTLVATLDAYAAALAGLGARS